MSYRAVDHDDDSLEKNTSQNVKISGPMRSLQGAQRTMIIRRSSVVCIVLCCSLPVSVAVTVFYLHSFMADVFRETAKVRYSSVYNCLQVIKIAKFYSRFF